MGTCNVGPLVFSQPKVNNIFNWPEMGKVDNILEHGLSVCWRGCGCCEVLHGVQEVP